LMAVCVSSTRVSSSFSFPSTTKVTSYHDTSYLPSRWVRRKLNTKKAKHL
jgi:hypothetical protein